MNPKTALGIVVVGAVLVAGYFLLNQGPRVVAPSAQTPVAATASSTTTTTPTQKPAITIDVASLTASAGYPTLTGTATLPTIDLILFNAKSVEIVRATKIPVVNHRWSYPLPIALLAGTYIVEVMGGNDIGIGTLTVH